MSFDRLIQHCHAAVSFQAEEAEKIDMTTIDNSMLYLGIDGGGSKCRATIVDADGRCLGNGVAGPANPFQDMPQAKESVFNAARLALADAGLEPDATARCIAGVGLAGVNLPRFYDAVLAWQHPFRAMYVATDLHIACLSAHGGGDGAVMVVGTGSCGYSWVAGRSTVCGAHGFPFGDKGSGAWLGLEAIKAVLLASDGLGPETILTAALHDQLGADNNNIIQAMAGAPSHRYGSLAPLVFAAAQDKDAVAMAILNDGAAYLEALAGKLLMARAPRLSLIGGLGEVILPWLSAEVRAHLVPALRQPEYGAIQFARQSWEQDSGAACG